MANCGAEEYIPLFAKKELTFKELQYMEDKELKEVVYEETLKLPNKTLHFLARSYKRLSPQQNKNLHR